MTSTPVSGTTEPTISKVGARAFTFSTGQLEANGTLAWDRTSIVMVRTEAAGLSGPGDTCHADAGAALIDGILASRRPERL